MIDTIFHSKRSRQTTRNGTPGSSSSSTPTPQSLSMQSTLTSDTARTERSGSIQGRDPDRLPSFQMHQFYINRPLIEDYADSAPPPFSPQRQTTRFSVLESAIEEEDDDESTTRESVRRFISRRRDSRRISRTSSRRFSASSEESRRTQTQQQYPDFETERDSILKNLNLLENVGNSRLKMQIYVMDHDDSPHGAKEYSYGDVVSGFLLITNNADHDIPFELVSITLKGEISVVKKLGEKTNLEFLNMVDLESCLLQEPLESWLHPRTGMIVNCGLPKNRLLRSSQVYKLQFLFTIPSKLLDTVCARQISEHLELPPSFGISGLTSAYLGGTPSSGFAIHDLSGLRYGYEEGKDFIEDTDCIMGSHPKLLRGGDGILVNDVTTHSYSISYAIQCVVIGKDKADRRDSITQLPSSSASSFQTEWSRLQGRQHLDISEVAQSIREMLQFDGTHEVPLPTKPKEKSNFIILNDASFLLRVVPRDKRREEDSLLRQRNKTMSKFHSVDNLRVSLEKELGRVEDAVDIALGSPRRAPSEKSVEKIDRAKEKNLVRPDALEEVSTPLFRIPDDPHDDHRLSTALELLRENNTIGYFKIKYPEEAYTLQYQSPLVPRSEHRGWRLFRRKDSSSASLPEPQLSPIEFELFIAGLARPSVVVTKVNLMSITVDSQYPLPVVLEHRHFCYGTQETSVLNSDHKRETLSSVVRGAHLIREFDNYRERFSGMKTMIDSYGLTEEVDMSVPLIKSMNSILSMRVKKLVVGDQIHVEKQELAPWKVDSDGMHSRLTVDVKKFHLKETLVPSFQTCLISRLYCFRLEMDVDKQRLVAYVPVNIV